MSSDTSAAPAAISLRQTTPTMKWLGKSCPKCNKEIAVGDQVVLCSKCFTPQHAQCWRDNGNQCAVDQTPARIIEPRGRAAGAAAEGGAAAAPAAPAAAAAAPAAPAARPAAAVPAAAATPVAAGPAPTTPLPVMANPWQYARPLQGPDTPDLWRRSVITIVVLLFIWGLIMASYAFAVGLGVIGNGVV